MRTAIIVLSFLIAIVFVGNAMAVGPGKTVEFPDGDQGKVIFSGDTHGMKQGMKCMDCHPKIFAMKKGAFKETKEDHGKDVYCGVCHNGTKAFSQSDEKNCGKCHKKTEAAPEKEAAPPSETVPENQEPTPAGEGKY